jgi:hypothetical protein
MELQAGFEPAFAAPITVSRLENYLGYWSKKINEQFSVMLRTGSKIKW